MERDKCEYRGTPTSALNFYHRLTAMQTKQTWFSNHTIRFPDLSECIKTDWLRTTKKKLTDTEILTELFTALFMRQLVRHICHACSLNNCLQVHYYDRSHRPVFFSENLTHKFADDNDKLGFDAVLVRK